MWLLDPWIEQLQNTIPHQTEFSPFIWEPKPEGDWKDREDEDDDADENNEVEGRDDSEYSEDEADKPAPLQAKNVDGFWDTGRLRRVMQRETRKRVGIGIGVAWALKGDCSFRIVQRTFSVMASAKWYHKPDGSGCGCAFRSGLLVAVSGRLGDYRLVVVIVSGMVQVDEVLGRRDTFAAFEIVWAGRV
ncbi:hypothetical protein LTR49_025670 [Elasticomyces elasticus]|nr:hypothetical protein LTR49_025670 [Elasticomyces elasticus]